LINNANSDGSKNPIGDGPPFVVSLVSVSLLFVNNKNAHAII